MNQFHILWGLLLLLFANPIQIAYFNIADQGFRAGTAFNSILPEVSLSRNLRDANFNVIKKNTIKIILLITVLTFLGILFSNLIVITFFGIEYESAIMVLYVTIFIWCRE